MEGEIREIVEKYGNIMCPSDLNEALCKYVIKARIEENEYYADFYNNPEYRAIQYSAEQRIARLRKELE